MEGTETPTLPTTTETPSAAPATSAPSASPSESPRPKSFEEAFEQVAAKQDQPAPDQPAAAATAQPGATPPAGTKPEPGPIPFKDHKTILENTRTKAAADAVAQYRQQHGWAETVKREDVEQFQALMADPVDFGIALIEKLRADPTHGPRLRSHAARTLASGRSQAPVDLSPDLQVTDANGNVVSESFSAKKVQALIAHAVQDAIGKEIAPLKQDRAARLQAIEQAQAKEKAEATEKLVVAKTDEALAEIRDILDGDDSLFADVSTAMDAHPTWSVHKAALEVRKAKILPAAEGKATQKALASLQQKAGARTANGAGATGAPAKPRTVKELEQWLAANAR